MADSDLIKEEIINAIIKGRHYEENEGFYVYEKELIAHMTSFEPAKPVDNIPGFLSYKQGENRVKSKTGRFLTKKLMLGERIPESTIRDIADKINSTLFADIVVRLDTGRAITENYRKHVGGSSCMSGDESCYTRLYEYNTDRFQQLIMNFVSDSARAMVHKLDNGQYLLDRVYGSSEHLKEKMQEYAAERGWLWYGDNEKDIYLGEVPEPITNYSMIVMTGLVFENDEVPYMDTFYKYRVVKCKLNIYHNYAVSGSYHGTLDSTEGTLLEGVQCVYCEEEYPERDTTEINGDTICESCLNDNFTRCYHCNTWHENDCMTTIISHSQYISSIEICDDCLDNYRECYECDGWFREGEVESIKGSNVCSKCIPENYHKCEDCDEWFSELNELKCNEWVCDSCLEDYYKCNECDDYVTLNEVVISKRGNTCLDCAGLGDCKGQSKFEFDDYPGKVEMKSITIQDMFNYYTSIDLHSNYGISRPVWTVSEVNA